MQVRVTRSILANNAGGAGYFDASVPTGAASNPDDGFVSMEEIAAGFLETLKRSNFNAGTNTGSQATSTGFTLDKIFGTSSFSEVDNASIADSSKGPILRNSSDVAIGQNGVTTEINGKKTIVVRGRLTINGDIKANDTSVAFIADEISIGANVTRLDGVYIANKITGVSAGSQLIVNGSLYGDAMSGKGGRVGIVPARTYARGSSASQGIVTGILINYSSRVLSDPPPLVSDFLSQYDLTKVTSVQ